MRSLERHRDVGAYALGVLDEADAFRFEDHLMECARCAAHVTEFGPTTRQLLLYRRATPHAVHPMAQPGPRMLERLLGEVAVRRRAARRRFLYAVAASVVFAVAGPGVAFMTGHVGGGSSNSSHPDAMRMAATDAHTGVWAEVRAQRADWGSQVQLKVKNDAGHSCRLVAIGTDGSQQTVTSWSGRPQDTRMHTMSGGAAMPPDQIAGFEVQTSNGEHLVTLK